LNYPYGAPVWEGAPMKGTPMKNIFMAIVASTILISPAFAQNNQGGGGNNNQGGGFHGAPGPIAGASLPVLAVGLGVYWLVRRRRKAN
jgi:hypothetical protein